MNLSKLTKMGGFELEDYAYDTFNKSSVVENFTDLMKKYKMVVRARARGQDAHCEAAEKLAALIESGATVQEIETSLTW